MLSTAQNSFTEKSIMTELARDFIIYNGILKPVTDCPVNFTGESKYIYEVFRVQRGVPVFIEDHLDRLWHTAALEKVNLHCSRETILENIFRLIGSNPANDGNIKIYVSTTCNEDLLWLVYFTPHQYPSPRQFKNGVAVKIFNAERLNPNAKTMDTLLRRTTERIKTEQDVNEVLLVDQSGYITEGSRSNVFFVVDDSIVTPPLHQILEGVTRKQVLKLCKSAQIPVMEKSVHNSILSQVEGAFITGTSRRVLPVNRIDNIKIHVVHPIVRQLQRLLENRVREYISEFKARQNL